MDTGYHQLIGRRLSKNLSYTPDELWEKAFAYFEYMQNRSWDRIEAIKGGDRAGDLIRIPVPTPMTIESFCMFAGISPGTFNKYRTSKDYPDHNEVAEQIYSIISTQNFEGGMVGSYHAGLAARKLGLAEKQDITSGGDKLAPPIIVFKKSEELK